MKTAAKKMAKSTESKGELRYRLILESAEYVLINHGYHNFTLRKIAQTAGISMGNLQYYFPTKDDLTRALCEYIVREYTGFIEQFLLIDDPQEQFENAIEHIINDLNSERTTRLFPELWSLSNHEEHVVDVLDSIYEPVRKIFCIIIMRMNPELKEKDAYLLAVYITSAMEGFTMFVGHKKPWIKETDKFVKLSIKGFKTLVMDAESSE